MTINEILDDLLREVWIFESYTEQDEDTHEVSYVVKLKCGVQARGRYKQSASTFEEALRKVHKEVIDRWGRV